MEDDIYLQYLREYYGKYRTINNIRYDAIVDFEGRQLQIGCFLNNMRALHKHFLLGENINGAMSFASQYRYHVLDSMEFVWNPRKEKVKDEDIYIRYLRWHFKTYGTVNNIKRSLIVDFENKKVKIGSFLNSIRAMHKNFLLGIDIQGSFSPTSIYRYKALDSMGIIWEPSKEGNFEDDIYIRYLRYHYEKYGSINNIEYNAIVTFEGQELMIGSFLSRISSKHKNFLLNKDINGSLSSTSILRYRALDEMNFDWDSIGLGAIARENKIAISTFLMFTRIFNGNIDKTLKFALLGKKNKTFNRIEEDNYTLMSISKKFGIDIEELVNFLNNKDGLREINAPSEIVYQENMSLGDFCISNGYYYDIILYAVKLKYKGLFDEDFDSLINRSILEHKIGKNKKISNWVYFKYGNEISLTQFLSAIGFNPRRVLYDMSKNVVSLDRAFENESFKSVVGNRDYDYLREVYGEVVAFDRKVKGSDEYRLDTAEEMVFNYEQELFDEYYLTNEERNIICSSFQKYKSAFQQYRLFDVGFEKDDDRRIHKILNYSLDSDDIEEAFFIPLKFDSKVLIGRDSHLYRRRVLLKNLTVSWNDLGEEERDNRIRQYDLTSEEVYYVNTTRKNIDRVKAIVLEKSHM